MQEKKAQKIKEFSGRKIGQRLREIRESRGLTQQALAERSGITSQAITQVETGRRKPSFGTLVAIAQGLGMSLDSLVGVPTSKYPHDILKDAGVMAMAEKVSRMPKDLQKEVSDFVDFVWEKRVGRGRTKS
ncbi:helix-turn-helix domain-containing protein [Verrucomicrobiota bacterium]